MRYVSLELEPNLESAGFCYSSLAAWNSLFHNIYDITDTNTFKIWLKSVVFDVLIDYCMARLKVAHSGALQISY